MAVDILMWISIAILIIIGIYFFAIPPDPNRWGTPEDKSKRKQVYKKKVQKAQQQTLKIQQLQEQLEKKLAEQGDSVPTQTNQKDWSEMVSKLERQIGGIKKQMTKLQNDLDLREAELKREKEGSAELLKKLSQEKAWREKEQEFTEKSREREKDVHTQLKKLQQEITDKQSALLINERELKEYKKMHSDLTNEHRKIKTELAGLQKIVEENKVEINDLRRNNAELKKKKEAEVWVAKEDHDALQAKYKQIERQLRNVEDEKKKLEIQLEQKK